MDIFKTLNGTLSVLRTNPYLFASINLFLILYASFAAPNLPANIAGMFENPIFKLLIMTLLMIFVHGRNWTTAILVAVGFTLSMMTLSRYRTSTLGQQLSSLGFGMDKHANSWGPNGQPVDGSTQEAHWGRKSGVNHIKLRGHHYSVKNEPNLLPGGHGKGTPGYEPGLYASYGTPDSQL